MTVQLNAKSGPSQPRKGKQAKAKRENERLKKTKFRSEVQDLDRLASDFDTSSTVTEFSDLPISINTKRGLKKAFFTKMTDIQARSLPYSLKGKDVLGSARTGSGKTLSFLIPILEVLFRKKWGPQDGLGALVISPTRELAVQIFEVLTSIGGYHTFSAGLVIGGKNLNDERERLGRMNILVATPGRLLQHMDQTFGFDASNLQMLVLDEADRILDMGFQRTLNALLEHLPPSRQSLLFSATQTDSVKDLARLSLHDPVYVGVKEEGYLSATPKSLEQHYVVCDLDKKLDILWSFIKSHLQSKVLVFVSSGKQVRFVFETFCKLHPGMPLMHLHGKQKQATRLGTCAKFTTTKHAVLFSTDLAARGLDFPSVDWVFQVDAPEDADTYIHRVGRTARYESKGKGLLLLCPTEVDGMLAALSKKDINIEQIKIKGSKTQSIEKHLQNLAFQDPEIKYLGQRAFVSYMRSVFLHKDKTIFKVDELPADRFAESLGLPGAPKIKFLSKDAVKKRKNASHAVEAAQKEAGFEVVSADDDDYASQGESDENSEDEDHATEGAAGEPPSAPAKAEKNVRTKYDRMFERKNQNILSDHYTKLVDHSADNAEEEDFITLKRVDHALPEELPESHHLSKRKQKMGTSKKSMLKLKGHGEKLLFDEDGNPRRVYELRDAEEEFEGQDVLNIGREFAEEEKGKLKEADVQDKADAKARRTEKKRKRKEREKEGREPGMAVLQPQDDEGDGYESPSFDFVPSGSESDRPAKKSRPIQFTGGKERVGEDDLDDDEELALKLLNRR